NNLSILPSVIAVDTETDDGNIFLIAVSNGNYLDHPNINFESIAKFLLKYQGKLIFFYNLSYDAECILKLLPEHVLKSYKWKRELR
ncbi:MAG: hypothetical protein KGH89_09515, partial [Thaumarchaeota archaeon]|nr:hypothetical protein [Nitrososphaerota archaeon]